MTRQEISSMEQLRNYLDLTEKASRHFERSLAKCRELASKGVYSEDDQEVVEAFSARFARLRDILTQKVFRSINALELGPQGTVLDLIHMAEKNGLIRSAETWRRVRELRNEVAHEYSLREMKEIVRDLLDLSQELTTASQATQDYAQKLIARLQYP